MDTEEINCMLSKDDMFRGTYPCDKIPRFQKRPATVIVNTDSSNKPGEHWIAIHLKKNGKGRYFDSYGLKPFNQYILEYLKDECANGFKYNPITLQTPNVSSFTCGHYCVLFCMCVSSKVSFEKFLKLFSKNTLLNDFATLLVVESNQSCMK
jgi:hypothetical protein